MRLLYFIIYILIEIALFSIVGDIVGTPMMLVLVVAGFFLGGYLIRSSGSGIQQNLANARSQFEARTVSTTFSRIIAGLLLIIPGFFTDIVGLLILFEPTRHLITKLFKIKTTTTHTSRADPYGSDNIIEGEVIDRDIEK